MAGGHGGYRQPAKPAPVSGPGRLSRRTDGQVKVDLPNAGYGEQADFQSIEGGAPMGISPAPMGSGTGAPVGTTPGDGGMAPPTPLSAPSERPWEPVTQGAAAGPGMGQIMNSYAPRTLTNMLSGLNSPDLTGDVADLLQWVESRGL